MLMFRYDPDIVEAIKTLPSWDREYDPSRKQWTIENADAASELASTLADIGCNVTGLTPAAPVGEIQWAVELFKAVGPQRADAVARALTKVLHPDTPTGSTRLQQQLNDAKAQL
ncbi:hypothetical protein GBP75_23215 [Mycobacterium avium subsp. hominissuis]|nr:hypothetical protein [Mycobacterium avium subsp. hominissuis]MBZ4608918.1 hypothetical protein [Mycobacterium avium subsp. hominissuis]